MPVDEQPSRIVEVLEDPDEAEILEAVRELKEILGSAEPVNAIVVVYRDAVSALESSRDVCVALSELSNMGVDIVLVKESLDGRTIKPPCNVKFRIEPMDRAFSFKDSDLLIVHGSTCPYSVRR